MPSLGAWKFNRLSRPPDGFGPQSYVHAPGASYGRVARWCPDGFPGPGLLGAPEIVPVGARTSLT